MINLYPAIDLFQGKVVRLLQGDFDRMKVYRESPEDQALEWESQGARWIHVVDLEGARSGTLTNLDAVKRIRDKAGCRIQLGGGIRREEDIEALIAAGIDRLVLGTKVLESVFLNRVLERFKDRIAVGLDVRDGRLKTEGWRKESGILLTHALDRLKDSPIQTIIYTEIRKDGMLEGPDFEGLKALLDEVSARVILSGGVSTLEDIRACARIGHPRFEGAIIGKALYENKFTLSEALQLI